MKILNVALLAMFALTCTTGTGLCQFCGVSLVDSWDFDSKINRNIDQWDRDNEALNWNNDDINENEFHLEDWEWDHFDDGYNFGDDEWDEADELDDDDEYDDSNLWDELDEEYDDYIKGLNDKAVDLQNKLNALEIKERTINEGISKLVNEMRKLADCADSKAAETSKAFIKDALASIAVAGFAGMGDATSRFGFIKNKLKTVKNIDMDKYNKTLKAYNKFSNGAEIISASHDTGHRLVEYVSDPNAPGADMLYLKGGIEYVINANPYTGAIYTGVKGFIGLHQAKGSLNKAEQLGKTIDKIREAKGKLNDGIQKQLWDMATQRDHLLTLIPPDKQSKNTFDADSIRKNIRQQYNRTVNRNKKPAPSFMGMK